MNQSAGPGSPLPMRLLAAGVPLSLLLDLASPTGPDSAGIASTENHVGHPGGARTNTDPRMLR